MAKTKDELNKEQAPVQAAYTAEIVAASTEAQLRAEELNLLLAIAENLEKLNK